MKLNNTVYGFLISVTTMFGGNSVQVYAQTKQQNKDRLEQISSYKREFLQTIAPEHNEVEVDFVVDSVPKLTSNGDLVSDVNVIQVHADVNKTKGNHYLDYMNNRHIAAHEMWHRISMMKDVLTKPLSASLYRNGRDNFEISAGIVQLLTFRDDYLKATPEERRALRQLKDPKIRMYIAAVEHHIINPFSHDKKDFDFEMEFIAKSVSSFWNYNMAPSYANHHNNMTRLAGRKEFNSPVYEKNFYHDIKTLNSIGGIDFSKYYDVKDVRLRGNFEQGFELDTATFVLPLNEPDYETWVDKKSAMKRFSYHQVKLPNFNGNRLSYERENRKAEQAHIPYRFLYPTGSKVYFGLQTTLYTAVALLKDSEIIKIYPHGAIDYIGAPDMLGNTPVTTVNYDGSYERGTLVKGYKNGTFVYYTPEHEEISRCEFKNNRAVNGKMIYAADDKYIVYVYEDKKLTGTEVMQKNKQRRLSINSALLKNRIER